MNRELSQWLLSCGIAVKMASGEDTCRTSIHDQISSNQKSVKSPATRTTVAPPTTRAQAKKKTWGLFAVAPGLNSFAISGATGCGEMLIVPFTSRCCRLWHKSLRLSRDAGRCPQEFR